MKNINELVIIGLTAGAIMTATGGFLLLSKIKNPDLPYQRILFDRK